jgi:outer membrane lipoprotein carrier protein
MSPIEKLERPINSIVLIRGLVIVSLLISTSVSGATGIDQLNRFFSSVNSFGADFEQLVIDESGAQLQSSSGHMVLQRPDRFRWDYQEPYEQLIVGNAEKIWIYDPDLEQVTVKRRDETLGQTPARLLSATEPLENSFSINELGPQGELQWVELLPLNEDVTFQRIKLAFRDELLRVMELEDGLGNTTAILFDDVVSNAAVDPSLFDFNAPAGVDVVGP